MVAFYVFRTFEWSCMGKNKDVFYTTKNNKVAHFTPGNIKKRKKPWTAMHEKGKIIKKTVTIPKIPPSNQELSFQEGYRKDSRPNEIREAKWIQDNFKLKVTLKKELPNAQYNPDAIVKEKSGNKYWEFKDAKKNKVSSLVNKGRKQVNVDGKDKAGSVIVFADELKENVTKMNKDTYGEIVKTKNLGGNVLIKKKKTLHVYKIKK